MFQKGCAAYKISASNATDSKNNILLKLYEGTINFMHLAQHGIKKNSPKIRGENISKIMAIITELDYALDRSVENTLTDKLSALYGRIMDLLSTANVTNDISALEEAESLLVPIKEGFEEVAKKELTDTSVSPDRGKEENRQRRIQVEI